MAGESQLTRLFLGLGLREFSMHPSQLLGVKQRVLQSNVAALVPLVERIRRADDPERLATLLERLNA
jgi:phosphotransferase system enzyme I (PtsI)